MQYHQANAAAQHAAQNQARQALPAQAANPAPQFNISQSISAKYEVIGKIGEGTYGVVYLARSKDGAKNLYAIKTFKTAREGDGISPTAIREIMLLRELKHESIVRLNSVHINRQEPSLSLAFDYAEYDLYEMIRHHRDKLQCVPMDPFVVKSTMWQLLNGLSYMHQNWIIHRDLKPSNVLVMGEGEEYGLVKIADFGLARIFQSPLRPLSDNGVVVTIWYRSPELLLGGRHYTRAVDVWAAGCIWAELLMLKPLFQGSEKKQQGNPFQTDQLDKIFRVLGFPSTKMWPDLEYLMHWHDNTENIRIKRAEWSSNKLEQVLVDAINGLNVHSPESKGANYYRPTPLLVDLLKRMLEYDPAKRITAEEALEHAYFLEEPRPSYNVLMTTVQGKKVLQTYPRRIKHNVRAGGDPPANHPNPVQPINAAAAAGNRAGAGGNAVGGMTRKRKAEFGPRIYQ